MHHEALVCAEKLVMSTMGEDIWQRHHHALLNIKSPETTLVVLYRAATFDGTAFTARILPGPEWATAIIPILCRFLIAKFLPSAGIKQMLLQMNVPKEDKKALTLSQ